MKLSFRYFIVLLVAVLQSCGTCSQHHANSGGVEASQVNHGREVWSTLAEVGYPVIPDTIASRVLERYCYTVSHNKKTRQPNWVMWQLTREHVMNRKEGVWSDYREDDELPAEERATLEDYASSGYDRGHMCPGGDCNWDDVGRDETFVLSNLFCSSLDFHYRWLCRHRLRFRNNVEKERTIVTLTNVEGTTVRQ